MGRQDVGSEGSLMGGGTFTGVLVGGLRKRRQSGYFVGKP